jgi:RNA polymerase sigma factor (sigma-70 family)
MNEVTRILSAIERGDRHAADQLLPLVYDELRKLAAQKLAHEKPGQTLDATALVHKAYLRLVASPAATAPGELGALMRPRAPEFANRGHFFVAAAEAMHRILIEQARRKQRERHGGGRRRLELLDPDLAVPERDEQVLLLDEALTRLAGIRPQAAKLVELRFFSGLTVEEAAPILDISPRTTRRIWVFARAWLRREMDALADH